MVLSQKEFVEDLKGQWKRLWQERHDDKVRAEGVAVNDYESLFVDKGTIIHATRDFKALNFKDILEQHEVENIDRYVPPNPHIGGWGKFVKDQITITKSTKKKAIQDAVVSKAKNQQLKKNGRGWLNK